MEDNPLYPRHAELESLRTEYEQKIAALEAELDAAYLICKQLRAQLLDDCDCTECN